MEEQHCTGHFLKETRKTLLRTLAMEEEAELNSAEVKAGRIFKGWGKPMEVYWRTLVGRLVNEIRPSVFANSHLTEVRLLSSHRDWEKGAPAS